MWLSPSRARIERKRAAWARALAFVMSAAQLVACAPQEPSNVEKLQGSDDGHGADATPLPTDTDTADNPTAQATAEASASSDDASAPGATAIAAEAGSAQTVMPSADAQSPISTSAKWLLFRDSGDGNESLAFLDLQTGERHSANPRAVNVRSTFWAPDQRSLLFEEATPGGMLWLVRFTEAGFVPAEPIEGYADAPGSFSQPDWDESSRYLLLRRLGEASGGLEVVDVLVGRRHAHLEFDARIGLWFAPRGPYFAFFQDAGNHSISSVTDDGMTEPWRLPEWTFAFDFSRDGQRVYVGTTEPGQERRQYYLDLPETVLKELVVTGEGERVLDFASFGPTEDSVLMMFGTEDDDVIFARAFFDGRPRVVLSQPGVLQLAPYRNHDHNLLLFRNAESLELVRVEPLARHQLRGDNPEAQHDPWTTGMVGNYAFHQSSGQLYLTGFDADEPFDVAISELGDSVEVDCHPSGDSPASSRFSYFTDERRALTIVDLSRSPPSVALEMTTRSPEGTFGCPLWLLDESAFAVTETSDVGSRVYIAEWTGAEWSEPQMVLESPDTQIGVVAFSY